MEHIWSEVWVPIINTLTDYGSQFYVYVDEKDNDIIMTKNQYLQLIENNKI